MRNSLCKQFVFIFVFFCVALHAKDRCVAFFSASPNSSQHFHEFTRALEERGISCLTFNVEDDVEKIAKQYPEIDEIVTEISLPESKRIHEVFFKLRPDVKRAAYYDNPESFVPGGYSQGVSSMLEGPVQEILFANHNHIKEALFSEEAQKIDTSHVIKRAIGYYPLKKVQEILDLRNREKRQKLREDLFSGLSVQDRNQKIFVYVGGANDYYYNSAWPFFLKLLSKAFTNSKEQNFLVILQQHPRARSSGNADGKLLIEWKRSNPLLAKTIEVSCISTEEALALSDGVFYSQTSMAPIFALTGTPTMQIGPKPLDDLLIRNQLCPHILTAKQLLHSLAPESATPNVEAIYEALGFSENWQDNLAKAISDSN